jgi:tetratricopeptide (TPR) repeat protein
LLDALPGDDSSGRAALCESFLEGNPRSKVALHGLSEALGNSTQWERLSAAYERLLSRQVAPDAVVRLCLLQARLSCNQLQDPKRALPAIERATQLEPENVELQLEAAAMYEQLDDIAAASAHYLAAVDTAPLDAEVHRRLYAFFVYAQKPDRAWQSAATLVSLGAANADEVAAYDRHESGALHRPGRPVVSEDWMLGLEPGASDPALTTLLELVSHTALACFQADREQLATVRSRVQLEDVATSTTMLARSLGWTTQLLSLPRPALYLDEGDAPPAPLPVRDLAWVVGREFGRGQHQAHLVFHWARSLAANLGTARALRLYPAGEGSSQLLSACLAATRKPPLVKAREVFDLALALREKLTPQALKSLLGVLDQASPEQWQRRLESFEERVALCSNRAGLLACGDPAIAARALANESPTEPAVSSQLADLFVYAASDEYAELRMRLGIARAA